MLRKAWLYFFLQLVIFHYQLSNASPFVGKAFPAKKGEFPFIVSLSYDDNIIDKKSHFCGGALISKRHVLTSQHCLKCKLLNDVLVIVRTLDFNSGQVYRVRSWVRYEIWALSHNKIPEGSNIDIAIITLTQDVKNVEPGKISKLNDTEVIGKDVVTAGWGMIDETKEIAPDTMMKVNLKVLNAGDVKKYHYQLFKHSKGPEPNLYYTSADPPAVLGCGDSGSPLLLVGSKEIVGVNEAACNIKNPHTNPYAMSRHVKLLPEYKEFIEDMKRRIVV